jgi:hypothetical protein
LGGNRPVERLLLTLKPGLLERRADFALRLNAVLRTDTGAGSDLRFVRLGVIQLATLAGIYDFKTARLFAACAANFV